MLSWIIKVRLVRRTEVLVTPNKDTSKKEVKRINMCFQDESGNIKAVAFNEDADRFDSILKIDAIYEISHCNISKPFLNNDFPNVWELKFTPLTKVSYENYNDVRVRDNYFLFPFIYRLNR